ncbi:MAG: phosphate ABC transporter permease PstA [Erythrobacter sp.]|nr:phosphate ABC transporter permease PstA [Erythrobacter sp.]RZV32502.1 MAG: phosphate ABC transporter permease PstA [Sphingomonadaceae bacterium]
MSDIATPSTPDAGPTRTAAFEQRLKRRYAAERRFKRLGLAAIGFSVLVLVLLLGNMLITGAAGFQREELRVEIDLANSGIAINAQDQVAVNAVQRLEQQGLREVVAYSAELSLGAKGAAALSDQAWRDLADAIIDDPTLLEGSDEYWLPASASLARAVDGEGAPELQRLAGELQEEGKLATRFDFGFLSRSDATDPQMVGIWGALKGSMLTMLVTLLLAFPIGVLAAVYLEEYAAKTRWTDIIEVSINNLAAVPSIIFGLLGLAVFLWIFPTMRSAPLIGGMTLALMTMPVIVISGRNAIKAVPPSIRDGALAVGASPVQVVFHHVLPLALPGILTGTIIGMARALGETAPLLMIGMRAFVATPPDGLTSAATVLPVQIFLWSDEIDRGFIERTSAAIIVLLLFLLLMNGIAIYLRNKFEKSW